MVGWGFYLPEMMQSWLETSKINPSALAAVGSEHKKYIFPPRTYLQAGLGVEQAQAGWWYLPCPLPSALCPVPRCPQLLWLSLCGVSASGLEGVQLEPPMLHGIRLIKSIRLQVLTGPGPSGRDAGGETTAKPGEMKEVAVAWRGRGKLRLGEWCYGCLEEEEEKMRREKERPGGGREQQESCSGGLEEEWIEWRETGKAKVGAKEGGARGRLSRRQRQCSHVLCAPGTSTSNTSCSLHT